MTRTHKVAHKPVLWSSQHECYRDLLVHVVKTAVQDAASGRGCALNLERSRKGRGGSPGHCQYDRETGEEEAVHYCADRGMAVLRGEVGAVLAEALGWPDEFLPTLADDIEQMGPGERRALYIRVVGSNATSMRSASFGWLPVLAHV